MLLFTVNLFVTIRNSLQSTRNQVVPVLVSDVSVLKRSVSETPYYHYESKNMAMFNPKMTISIVRKYGGPEHS